MMRLLLGVVVLAILAAVAFIVVSALRSRSGGDDSGKGPRR